MANLKEKIGVLQQVNEVFWVNEELGLLEGAAAPEPRYKS